MCRSRHAPRRSVSQSIFPCFICITARADYLVKGCTRFSIDLPQKHQTPQRRNPSHPASLEPIHTIKGLRHLRSAPADHQTPLPERHLRMRETPFFIGDHHAEGGANSSIGSCDANGSSFAAAPARASIDTYRTRPRRIARRMLRSAYAAPPRRPPDSRSTTRRPPCS
jgi:hypothetical protein